MLKHNRSSRNRLDRRAGTSHGRRNQNLTTPARVSSHLDGWDFRQAQGHRLLGYGGKCLSPHGHNYELEVTFESASLDSLGMVVDFGDLKSKVRAWVSQNWDHAFLLNDADTELVQALGKVGAARVFLLHGLNPTVENMAKTIYDRVEQDLGLPISRVTIWETTEQSATYRTKELHAEVDS